MTSREEFEIWFEENKGFMLGTRKVSKGDCLHIWQASREALVIDLPAVCAYEGLTQDLGAFVELTYERPEHDPVELLRARDVRTAIEAAGPKVKS